MLITAEKVTPESLLREAAAMTLRPGMVSRVSQGDMLKCEHSPIRTQIWWIKCEQIPTFVSVHFVRHKHGVEHFVQSNRDDRGGVEATRKTPINHGMLVNAQALITMSRKRLCFAAHKGTVRVMTAIRKAVVFEDPTMAFYMVPECVYRNGHCPELRECRVGLTNVLKMYRETWSGD